MAYLYKRDSDGNITERKARCDVRGDIMKPGIHYNPDDTTTFAADKATIRFLLCDASAHQLPTGHFDISSAFLHELFQHSTLVYVWQHPLFDGTYAHDESTGQLRGNLYGTRQAGKIFCDGARAFLLDHGFTQTKSDPCLFLKSEPPLQTLVAVTIDDFLACASTPQLLTKLYSALSTKYNIKLLGRPTSYLNWKIEHLPSGIKISQPHIVHSVIAKTQMTNAKPLSNLYSDGIDMSPPSTSETIDETIATTFRETVGELRYLTDSTRPNIHFYVNSLARANHKPTQRHWKLLKRLIRFLKNTPTTGITFPTSPLHDPLTAFSDSDFANDPQSRKSISGILHTYHGAPMNWESQRQSIVALSTFESELMATADTTRHKNWLSGMPRELDIIPANHTTITYTNSQSAIQVATQTAPTKRRNLIDLRFHYIIDCIQRRPN